MAALASWTPRGTADAADVSQRILARLLRSRDLSAAALSRRVEEGLPFRIFAELAECLGLTHEAFGALLRLSPSTLYRRRRGGRFAFAESDRLWRYLHLYAAAADVLEGSDAAADWLRSELPALSGGTPLEAARNAPGARAAEELLTRLEFGVFA